MNAANISKKNSNNKRKKKINLKIIKKKKTRYMSLKEQQSDSISLQGCLLSHTRRIYRYDRSFSPHYRSVLQLRKW